MELSKELETAKQAALEAGERILEVYASQDTGARSKEDGSPVTEADLRANAAIVARLRADFPGYCVLTEEEADSEDRVTAESVWIVDPLDGTKEFISRNGEFTVNIGLVREERPVLGVVYVPVKGELYYASRGAGAFLGRDGGAPRRLAVSSRREVGEMVLAKSRSHASGKVAAFIERYGPAGVLARGSSLKGCMVATGDADVYLRFGPTNEWDICAMQIVVEEAGGAMTDLEGDPMRYNQAKTLNSGFAASNGAIHEEIVAMAKDC